MDHSDEKDFSFRFDTLFTGNSDQMAWDHFRRQQQAQILDAEPIAATEVALPANSLKEMMGQALEVPNLSSAANINPICQQFWRQVIGTSLSEWFKEVAELGWVQPTECQSAESPTLAGLAKQAFEICAKTAKSSPECNSALLKYRAQLATEMFRDKRNYQDMPLSLLLTKVYGQAISEEKENSIPASELFSMVEALLQRQPQNYSVHKLAVIALFSGQMRESDPELKAAYEQKLNAEIDQAAALNDNDPDLLQVELMHHLEAGEEGYPELERFANAHPKSGEAQYFLAAALCRVGDKEGCLGALEKSLQIAPSETRYRDSLQKVRAAEDVAQRGMFSIQINFDAFNW